VIEAKPGHSKRDDWHESGEPDGSRLTPKPPRKATSQDCARPYRKPTLVGRGNPPEVNERPSVKELGKMTPYLRKKGSLSSSLVQTRG
jgi:hypothetical protein